MYIEKNFTKIDDKPNMLLLEKVSLYCETIIIHVALIMVRFMNSTEQQTWMSMNLDSNHLYVNTLF